MKITFVNKMEKEKLIDELGRFGIKEIPFLLIRSSVDRIRAYSGNLDADSLARLAEKVYVETIGLYFARLDGKDLRLSLDALHLLKEQITDNIIELDDEQFEEYIKGRDIELNAGQKDKFADKLGYFVLRYKDDLIGMAKIISGKFIKNYLPKERRRKSKCQLKKVTGGQVLKQERSQLVMQISLLLLKKAEKQKIILMII